MRIPFLPEWKELMFSGRKTHTCRSKKYGEAGERFEIFGATFELVSVTEHKEKLLKQCAAEREILVKLNDEHGTIKRLNTQQVEALANEIKEREKLGETQEQIIQVVEHQLSGITGELNREKRLSRYKSEAFWLGVVVVGLWVMN